MPSTKNNERQWMFSRRYMRTPDGRGDALQVARTRSIGPPRCIVIGCLRGYGKLVLSKRLQVVEGACQPSAIEVMPQPEGTI